MEVNKRLLFVHIPKSAGMSLFKAIKSIYGNENTIRYADGSVENKNKYLAMSKEEVRKYSFITGHLPLPLFLNKPISDYKIVTVVRDPIDRELSAYYYMKTWEKHPRYNELRKMDLYTYIDQLENSGRSNFQCWHLCEQSSFERAKQIIDEKIFLSAPVEYIKEFCKILHLSLQIPEIELKRENITSFRFTAKELHPDIINRLRILTEEDNKLYLYVKEKFEKEVLANYSEMIISLSKKDDGILNYNE